jgi:hypothetical protein
MTEQLPDIQLTDPQATPPGVPMDDSGVLPPPVITEEELPPIELEDGEEEEFFPTELPVEELEDQYASPFGEGMGQVFARSEEQVDLPPTMQQAEEAAEWYNMAAGDGMIQNVTPESVLRSIEQDVTSEDVKFLLDRVGKENADQRQRMIVAAIANPKVAVEQKMQLIRELDVFRQYDLNGIQRMALHNQNQVNLQDGTPEGEDDYRAAVEFIESIPADIEAFPPSEDTVEESRTAFQELLNAAYEDADSKMWGWEGAADFIGTLIPFRFQAPVMRIYNNLGLDEGLVDKSGHLMLGEALRLIREKINTMDEAEKSDTLAMVLSVLKPNSGIFKDGNNLVTTHTLSQIFYQDLFGEPYFKEASKADQDAYFKAKADMERWFNRGDITKALEAKERMNKARASAKGRLPGEDRVGFTQFVDNVGSVFDLAALGGVARATLQWGNKALTSGMRRQKRVEPDKLASAIAEALHNPKSAEALGITQVEALEKVLPSLSLAMQEGGVNGLGELIRRSLEAQDMFLRHQARSNLSMAQRADALKEVRQQFDDLASAPRSVVRLDESVIEDVGEGIRITGIFGRTTHKPYSTLAQARSAKPKAVEEVFGKDTPVDIVMRDPKTGKLVDVPKDLAEDATGEFFLRAQDYRTYDSAPNVFEGLVFGEKDIKATFGGGLWSSWVLPVGSMFSPEVFNQIARSSQHRMAFSKTATGLFSDISRLSQKQQRLLSSVLKEGEKANPATGVGKTFTPSELYGKGLDETAVKSYYGIRAASDIMHNVANNHLRTQYFRQGMRDIQGPNGRIGFAKPQRHVDVSNRTVDVYDPATDSFTRMTARDVDAVYGRGASLGELKQVMLGRKGGEATHVLIDPKNKTRVLPIPQQVLTKVEGYYPHMWEGNFILYGKTHSGNRVALGIARAESDVKKIADRARASLAKQQAAGKQARFAEIGYEFDRSLADIGNRGALMEDIYVNMGGPVFGHRNGGELRNLSKVDGDAMVDPILALMRGMELVGHQVTKGELATNLRMKLYNYAKSHGILKDASRGVPQTVDDLVQRADKMPQWRRAAAALKQIETYQYLPDSADMATSSFLRTAASILDRMGMRALAARTADQAGRRGDVMARTMGMLHRQRIASNPIGQFSLQATQSLMMLGLSPTAYLQAVRQTTGVAQLIGMRSLDLHNSKMLGKLGMTKADVERESGIIAKLIGVKASELNKLVDVALESGFIDSIGHNTMMRMALQDAAQSRMQTGAKAINKNPVARMLGKLGRGADLATFGVMSKIGFEGGEYMNRIATMMALYNRDVAKKTANLNSQVYLDDLFGRATELTGSMIPELSFQYQRGWWKAAMQWVSFQHKMLFLMMPETLGGSRQITAAQKWGIVLTQFLLFGRRAAGHVDVVYRLVENEILRRENIPSEEKDKLVAAWRHPATEAAVSGFLTDYAINEVIQGMNEEMPRFNFASRFAPGGGSEFIAERLFEISEHPMEALFGMGGEQVGDIAKFLNRARRITLAQAKDMDDIPLNERVDELMKQGGKLNFSFYNRYLASKAAMKVGGYMSAGGVINEGFSGELEANLFTHFGVMTKSREELYAAQDKYGEWVESDPKNKKQELEQLAQQAYRDMIFRVVQASKDSGGREEIFGTLVDEAMREQELLFSFLPREDAAVISDLMREKAIRAINNPSDSAERRFVEDMLRPLQEGGFGSDSLKVGAYLQRMEAVKNNPALMDIVDTVVNDAIDKHQVED